jgi:hypothetical protein
MVKGAQMIRMAVVAGALAALAQVAGAQGQLPSGQDVMLTEVLAEPMPDGLWLRLRFLAPAIGVGTLDFDTATGDMHALCRAVGLPMLRTDHPQAVGIIVSLSDRAVEFGVSDPEATQFFEAYRVQGDDCIWEEF